MHEQNMLRHWGRFRKDASGGDGRGEEEQQSHQNIIITIVTSCSISKHLRNVFGVAKGRYILVSSALVLEWK